MKIGVLGAGALGCALGGVLTQAGHEVWLVNHNAAHVNALRRHGLVMRVDGIDHTVPVRAATDCAEVAAASGVMDLLIVLVKSLHTRAVIESARALVDENTLVMSLQNGLGHEDVLAEVVGRAKVLAGKTYAGGVLLAPGHIIAGTAGKETVIGELDGSVSPRVQRIAAVFNQAGLTTTVSQNIIGTMWDKLLVNVATGALSAITRLPYGALYQVPEVEACAIAAVAETMAVAQASGIELTTTDPRAPWVKAATGLPADFKTSMLQSLEKGALTEIDFINGAVLRQGAQVGVPTPVNQALVACVKGLERGLFYTRELEHMTPNRAYVEHVAVRVRDIQWHIRFFHDVLGMTLREVQGPLQSPAQYWTLGGMQFISTPDFDAAPTVQSGWLAHLGIMVQDLERALTEAQSWGVQALPQGRNWLQLPDGLALELMQAQGDSVAQALAVQPRVGTPTL